MQLVDPGFRPRLMVEEVQALELVQRACAATAAAASTAAGDETGSVGGAVAEAGTAAAAVAHDPALARLLEQHSAGDPVVSVQVSHVQRLWAGMGAVLEVQAQTAAGVSAALIVKHVALPQGELSFSDRRKKLSYECEATFFESMAGDLRSQAGCSVPAGLLVDRPGGGKINIVMSNLPFRSTISQPNEGSEEEFAGNESESDEPDDNNEAGISVAQTTIAVDFLARMHAHTWGAARADGAVARGLQQQGSHGIWTHGRTSGRRCLNKAGKAGSGGPPRPLIID